MSSGGDKTEAPTPKRLEEARKKGQVAKSQDLNGAVVMLGGERQASRHVAFVTENYIWKDGQGIVTGGVRFFGGGSRTSTLFMSLSRKIIRFIDTIHREQVTTPVRFL